MILTGIGYDIHKLVRGRKLILGGVEFSYSLGLEGHSDADVLCHAIADALLGAVAEKDIGHHFPNNDPACRGMSSIDILRRVREILSKQGARPVNVDSTVIAENPKIGPRLDKMRANIAEALGLPVARVGVKATTNETIGCVGRGEGIAAMAVASVEVP